jgi:hydroxymethylpyrimidine/phosphomethylpyrimidine kinase
MKTVLTIAGSDCSGGAGIQADLKTIGAFGLYGMSVITSITVQNTLGVTRVSPLEADLVEEQIRAVFEDIVPDAVKIGMMLTEENIMTTARLLKEYREKGKSPFVVLDPVLVSTSGKQLLENSAEWALREKLFGIADLLTPNLPEANRIGSGIAEFGTERESMAEQIGKKYGCSVLIKGGHDLGHDLMRADDCLYNVRTNEKTWFPNKRIHNDNTHGTGCTLSSAIACGMASGKTIEEAVKEAKEYITGAIRDGLNLGHGNGPLNHFYKNTAFAEPS